MNASGPAAELRNIAKSFGTVPAIRDVSLTLERGSIHGIVGENGAGKSTLMNILYGTYVPDAGEIRIAGAPVRLETRPMPSRAASAWSISISCSSSASPCSKT